MIDDIPFLTERMQYADKRVAELKRAVKKKLQTNGKDICVYITGSYGRREAHADSDLDLFFIREGRGSINALPRVEKTLFDAALINTARKLKFPEFTKGGAYLDIHYLGNILEVLGSPLGDYRNFFTARMLLLLESRPVVNENYMER